jgi:hypothetical protein
MVFMDNDHEIFFRAFAARSAKASKGDIYRLALLYLLALADDLRMGIDQFYDFEKDMILTGGLNSGILTGTTGKVLRMGFNLYNGTSGHFNPESGAHDLDGHLFSPASVFDCVYAPWLYRALAIRFPYLGELDGGMADEAVTPWNSLHADREWEQGDGSAVD